MVKRNKKNKMNKVNISRASDGFGVKTGFKSVGLLERIDIRKLSS
jgi:hypothetical protein